jgi:hypothetical protein
MAPRTFNPGLTLPGSDENYSPLAVPELQLPQTHANSSALAKIEQKTELHIAAIYAHEQKAGCFIEVNMRTADNCGDAFSAFARSSESRVKEAQGTLFEKDVQLAEYGLRQNHYNAMDAILRDTARQTGKIAAASVFPDEEPKGFLARLAYAFGG